MSKQTRRLYTLSLLLFFSPLLFGATRFNMAQIESKGILQTPELLEYILNTFCYPRESSDLKQLRELNENLPGYQRIMVIPADEGQFLMMLLKLMNAKKCIEIGVLAGYSLLCTALAIPEDGKIIAIDIDQESFNLGKPIIENAGVFHKIDFRHGEALNILDDMMNKGEISEGCMDFAFVDADKPSYLKYHEKLMKIVKVGGVIAYDNTLCGGAVIADESILAKKNEYLTKTREHILHINKALAQDPRIDVSMVSIGDGVTLCRRLL